MALLLIGKQRKTAGLTAGPLWGAGYNTHDLLVQGDTTHRSSPVQIGALTDWVVVTGIGLNDTSGTIGGLKSDGTLWTWGQNTLGERGNGNTTANSSPVQVGSLTNWIDVDTNVNNFSAENGIVGAVKTDGTLWMWGNGSAGTLGQGDTTNYSSPVQVGSLTTWKSISVSSSSAMAIKTDGTLWGWGYNTNFGTLGLGNTTDLSSPVQVGSLTTWDKIVIDSRSATAIKTDGTLWSWGRNHHGQLGHNDTTDLSSPVQVGSATNWTYMGAQDNNKFFINTSNELWAVGQNNAGLLGLGDETKRSSLVQVGSLTDWSHFASHASHKFVKTDGTLWVTGGAWTSGQKWTGDTVSISSPVQIGSDTDWKSHSTDNHYVLGTGFMIKA